MFKKMVALLLVCCFAMSFVACGDKDGDDVSKPKTSKTESVNESESISEIESSTVTESSEIIESSMITEESAEESEEISEPEVKLSDSCEMVLASGIDSQGNVYELVGNDTETYAGVQVEIGVIKNNEWLVELTSDMPLVDADGTLYGKVSGGLEDFSTNKKPFVEAHFIGNGCFIYRHSFGENYQEIIYNAENGLFYITYDGDSVSGFSALRIIYSLDIKDERANSVIISDNCYVLGGLKHEYEYSENQRKEYCTIEVINTDTMEVKSVCLNITEKTVQCLDPLSCGLFAVRFGGNELYFFDLKGEIAIDMSEFDVIEELYRSIIFIDDKCTFKIKNNAGTKYEITIDKQGNVIDSRPLD